MLQGRTRRLGILLAAATLTPVVALIWLGVHILRQDRELERQRLRERLEVAAGRVAVDIERTLLAVEERLAAGGGIRFLPAGLESADHQSILYQPDGGSVTRYAPASALRPAERHEFERRDLPAAATAYRRLAGTSDVEVRAASLVSLGRVLRQLKDDEGALRAYRDLQDLGGVLVAGQPAALVGYQGRCKVEEAAEVADLQQCAAALAHSLASGEWPIDRATFELYRDLLGDWGAPPFPSEAIIRTDVALNLVTRTRLDPTTKRRRLLLLPLDGSDHRVLLEAEGQDGFSNQRTTAWTRDSRAVLVLKGTGQQADLWLVRTTGEAPRKLDIDISSWAEGVSSGGSWGFSLSPDGSRIAFLMGRTAAEIWALEHVLPAVDGQANRSAR